MARHTRRGHRLRAVFVRRRWPLPLLGASTALVIIALATGNDPAGFVTATVVAAYTVAAQTSRRTAWLADGTVAVVVYVAFVLHRHLDRS